MKRMLKSTAYPHYYKDYRIFQEADVYYVADLYNEIVAGPFRWMSEAEEYIDECLE